MSEIEDKIKVLEETLLHSDVRKNPEILNELFDENLRKSVVLASFRQEMKL